MKISRTVRIILLITVFSVLASSLLWVIYIQQKHPTKGTIASIHASPSPTSRTASPSPPPSTPTPLVPPPDDWPTYLGNLAHTGYNAQETILTPATLPGLTVKWTARSANGTSISAQPMQAHKLLYWGAWDGYLRATALDGSAVWQQYIGQSTAKNPNCVFPKAAGIASTATFGMIVQPGEPGIQKKEMAPAIFVGGGDATFYALAADTGAILWQTNLGRSPDHFLWGSPTVYDNKVYIGIASFGDCPAIHGQMFQLNATTGAIEHTLDLVPPGCLGGSLWSTPTFDVDSGILYITIGNPDACTTAEPYAYALAAVRAKDLTVVADWQIPKNQQGSDSDFGATPTLFTATINGVATPMVGAVNKNGTFYAFTRAHVEAGPVWEQSVAYGNNCPDCGDGSISPAAWDGTTLYIAGGNTTIKGQYCPGSANALNPATGALLWRVCLTGGAVLGALTALPGAVIAMDGPHIDILRTSDGVSLFHYNDKAATAFYASATIANGRIYAADMNGTLFALGL